MHDALHAHHFIFTPEKPRHRTKYGTNPSIEDVVKFLNHQGEDAQIIDGFYDGPEKSILVQSPKNVKGLFQMAKDFGQESVLHSQDGNNSLHFVNGPKKGQAHSGQGISLFYEKPPVDYSMIHTVDGPMYAVHHIDSPEEEMQKSEELEKADPSQKIRQVADQYATARGLKIQHDLPPAKVNPERAQKIAQAYHAMPHAPNDPAVKNSYNSLVNETKDQFNHLMNTGLRVSKMQPDMKAPYSNSQDLFNDIHENNHLWYYPTESGFGSQQQTTDHPMLAPTGIFHEGQPLLANDMFRIVHDYFGHAKEGFGFGPKGEENAWQHHMQMYTPEAQKALTSETRGQNSWVNFGPHAEHNRTKPKETVYADQKAGLLPDWAMEKSEVDDGIEDLAKASWNVREQRRKVFGTKSQPAWGSKMQTKHVNHIKDFAKRFLNIDLHPSGGKVDEKTGKRRKAKKDITPGSDKPDWRSGQLESQWNPDAMIHELAHLMLLPTGLGLKDGQRLMDKQYGDVQSKFGFLQQKKSQHEVQPMAAENLIRRFIGLPATTGIPVPVKSKRSAPRRLLEDPSVVIGTRVNRPDKAGNDRWVDLIRQSRFLTPENKQRMEDVFSKKVVFHPEQGWIPNAKADPIGVQVPQSTPDNAIEDDEEKLAASEDLNKAPLPYEGYDQEEAAYRDFPNFHDDDKYVHFKTTKLPNGLEYHQFRPKTFTPGDFKITHALYHPSDMEEPVAYMQTANVNDPMAEGGVHHNVVQWSEVNPNHRGKGLGRQMYLATLMHTGQLTSDERISPEAHKAWKSFRGVPGIGGRIAKFPSNSAELLMRPDLVGAYEADRHHVFIRDKKQIDMNKMFPKLGFSGENMAASEDMKKSISSLDDIRAKLEAPVEDEKIDMPDSLVMQWSTPIHRWKA